MNKPYTIPSIAFTFPHGGIAEMDWEGIAFSESFGLTKDDVVWTRDTLAYLVGIWTLTYESDEDETYEDYEPGVDY